MNNKTTTFHLARHGQTLWNTQLRIQGQLDSPLTERGEAQALQLAKQCEALSITQILSSSLGRAIQTAVICSEYLQVEQRCLAGLEERHFGTWQGKNSLDMQSHPDYLEITSQLSDCKPEQGESAKQVLQRFQQALKVQFSLAPDECYLIITHGDVLRCFMAQFQCVDNAQTGFDYANGQSISLTYDHQTECFSRL